LAEKIDNLVCEKEWMQVQRERQFRDWKFALGDDIHNIQRLEKKYNGIPFLKPAIDPITIPDDFVNWYFETCVSAVKPDGEFHEHNHLWYAINHLPEGYDATKSNFTKKPINFKEEWPDLYKQLQEQFPFKKVDHFDIFSNQRDVNLHRDHSYMIDLPLDFRIVLYDENPAPTLVCYEVEPSTDLIQSRMPDKYHRFNSEYFPTPTPINEFWFDNNIDKHNVYVWNTYRTKHKAVKNGDYKKLLLLFGWTNVFDWNKYEYLMDKWLKTKIEF